MTTDIDSNITESSMWTDDESEPSCYLALYVIKLFTLAIAIILLAATLVLIPCHRRLRKRHYIFPYNLVLSDLSGAIVIAIFEGTEEVSLKIEMFLVILSVTSFVVSLLSIVLVTGYQFITIRLDPFGARNIITTPRLIATCVMTWVISFSITSTMIVLNQEDLFFSFLLYTSLTTTIVTGLCYIFIYRSVAKVPCGGNITRKRKEENQRVLRTFGLVFGTSVLCWICPWVNWTLLSLGFKNECLYTAGDMMICVNWIANAIIYWWRLNEFRSMFNSCRRHRGTIDVQVSLVTDKD